ncbi:UNVERIFIED_CONTAM: hypothetical protein PYX00_009702 [Menopon gallinae]|uniref:Uncharacterized protein n=1 Tax=Menopon gallinae TaxID=328185 RepID=A0AAW2HCM3_9NEOP
MSGWGWGGGPPPPYTPSPPPILNPRRAASPRGPGVPPRSGYSSPTPRYPPSPYCPSPVPRFAASPLPRPYYPQSPVMCPSPEYYYSPYEGMYHPVDVSASAYTGVPLEPPAPLDETRATAEIIAAQSQDYVDEKLAEYQATIYLLQGESSLPPVNLIPPPAWIGTALTN